MGFADACPGSADFRVWRIGKVLFWFVQSRSTNFIFRIRPNRTNRLHAFPPWILKLFIGGNTQAETIKSNLLRQWNWDLIRKAYSENEQWMHIETNLMDWNWISIQRSDRAELLGWTKKQIQFTWRWNCNLASPLPYRWKQVLPFDLLMMSVFGFSGITSIGAV